MQQTYAMVVGVVEPLQPAVLMEDALRMNSAALVRHDVRVVRDFEAVPPVLAEKAKVLQILVNLIRNAIESMLDSTFRSLTISTQAGPRFLTVSIEDTGSGISETLAPQLFQPFVTSKQGGMGIGLSICRTIIESHGGRIGFEAGDDGGTVFRFTLPKAEVE